MKTHIIQLEDHDDAISTRDKMGWSQARHLLLVWPAKGRILNRRLDLILLQRHSQALGVQLAFVSQDADVRYHAHQLGIQVFDSVHQAQESRWRRSARRDRKAKIQLLAPNRPDISLLKRPKRESPPPSTLSRLALFSLGVLALLSILIVLLPSADIQLSPQVLTQETTLQVEASESTQRIKLSGQLPIQLVSVIVEGQDSIETSGTAPIPEHAASGSAVFTNLTDHPITIPSGTVVSTRGATVRFATSRADSLPAGPGQTLALPIKALQPGRQSNLPAGMIQAIEGPLGINVTVTNPNPTSGGSDLSSPVPTPLDQSRLHDLLEAALEQSALAELKTKLNPEDILLEDQSTQVQVLETTYDPPGFVPASLLNLRLRLEYQAPIVQGSDLETLATSILDANLPPGYSPVPGTLEINHLTNPKWVNASTSRWRMRAQRQIRAQVVDEQATQLAVGLSPAQAGQRLAASLPLAEAPHITLFPAWWPRMPFLPFRISITSES